MIHLLCSALKRVQPKEFQIAGLCDSLAQKTSSWWLATNSLKPLEGNGTPSGHPPDPQKQQKGLVQIGNQLPKDVAGLEELDIRTPLASRAFPVETHSPGTQRFL